MRHIYILLLLGALSFHSASHADTWTLRSDLWCPHTCEPGSKPGYMVEIVARAAKRTGNTLNYRLMPYARALADARRGDITGVIGITPGDEEGFLKSDPIGISRDCFFVTSDDSFRYTKISDLNALDSIGTVLDYLYADEFMLWQEKNPAKIKVAAGINPLRLNIKKLHDKEIRAFLENDAVFAYAQKNNRQAHTLISAGCLPDINLYIGFDAKHPKAGAMAKAVNEEIASMRKNGSLVTLFNKYGMK